ncbi:hypothetical protein LTR37_020858 [Vermiconidia calcicola]|uniref:Uncharacterized protein n=1 Tax=Vermiconidia calcicola TaxID=1690605 RepID=A0ACC3MAC2_9PEZI|nr:hypothetical protein LTR37_020858 [Vermiconidia calcicola]
MALPRWLAISEALAASFAAGQFPSPPEGITTKEVQSQPGVSIAYKETCICETKAKAWAGYVHMRASYLEDIEGSDPSNASMFFWYFEARKNPHKKPTAIYLAGGPGQSSLFGATSDGGPCYIGPDSNSTYENEWSWNDKANMLYIDQPVGTSYSYDTLVKSTSDLLFTGVPESSPGIVPLEAYGVDIPAENTTFLYGTFPSQNLNHTANTTAVAAVTLWHFAQAWFGDFPEWKTSDDRISIWGNSYGGHWVPASGAYIQKQNEKIQNGDISGVTINLDAIGITNGDIDMLYEVEMYPEMAYNNTYGVEVVPKKVYEAALKLYSKPKTGCHDLMLKCREAAAKCDPEDFANNAEVNKMCNAAQATCVQIIGAVQGTTRSPFDMAHLLPDGYPPQYTIGFFNQEWVQKELGSPVNFTANSIVVGAAILSSSGDKFKRAGMKDVEYLLDRGVKVALIYGDRDLRCPWLGAEKLSLAAEWSGAEDFRGAGYALIHTNDTYDGGSCAAAWRFIFLSRL